MEVSSGEAQRRSMICLECKERFLLPLRWIRLLFDSLYRGNDNGSNHYLLSVPSPNPTKINSIYESMGWVYSWIKHTIPSLLISPHWLETKIWDKFLSTIILRLVRFRDRRLWTIVLRKLRTSLSYHLLRQWYLCKNQNLLQSYQLFQQSRVL